MHAKAWLLLPLVLVDVAQATGLGAPDDPVVTSRDELLAQLNNASQLAMSLHVVGRITLGGQQVVIPSERNVTLWGEDAVLDAEGLSRVILVDGGVLSLRGVSVFNGSTSDDNPGGCVLVRQPSSVLRMANVTITHCETADWRNFRSNLSFFAGALVGGGLALIDGSLELESVAITHTFLRSDSRVLLGGAMAQVPPRPATPYHAR